MKMSEDQRNERLKMLMKKNKKIDPKKHIRDYNICQQYLNGESDEFVELLEESCKKVKKGIMYYHNNSLNAQDREDILSEVIVIMLSKLGSFKPYSRLHTWMGGIAKNLMLQLFARRKKENSQRQYEETKADHQIDKRQTKAEENGDVEELLKLLPEENIRILQARTELGESFEVIARDMGLSVFMVRKLYQESIEFLREKLLEN